MMKIEVKELFHGRWFVTGEDVPINPRTKIAGTKHDMITWAKDLKNRLRAIGVDAEVIVSKHVRDAKGGRKAPLS